MTPDIHQIVRISDAPNEPTEYKALCGYSSPNKKEFRTDRQDVERVSCVECIQRAHYVLMEKTAW